MKEDYQYSNKEFKNICEQLNLELTSDFGIINADGKRTREFISFIQERQNLPKSIRYTFVELVIASMNESILNKTNTPELSRQFKNYISPKIGDKSWYPQIDYWIGIKSFDEFPIGNLLDRYTTKKRKNRILVEYKNSFKTISRVDEEIRIIEKALKIKDIETYEERWDFIENEFGGNILDNSDYGWLTLSNYTPNLVLNRENQEFYLAYLLDKSFIPNNQFEIDLILLKLNEIKVELEKNNHD